MPVHAQTQFPHPWPAQPGSARPGLARSCPVTALHSSFLHPARRSPPRYALLTPPPGCLPSPMRRTARCAAPASVCPWPVALWEAGLGCRTDLACLDMHGPRQPVIEQHAEPIMQQSAALKRQETWGHQPCQPPSPRRTSCVQASLSHQLT